MPSSHRRKKPRRSFSSAPATVRDWAALPRDILSEIFTKLGPHELMLGAERACTAWRRAAVDEPAMWRRVDMGTTASLSPTGGPAMVRAAVDRGAGRCQAFSGALDTHLLFYLIRRAPCLKTLHIKPLNAPNKALNFVLKKVPHLEDLEISLTHITAPSNNLLASICQSCPGLKKLRLNCRESFDYGNGCGVAFERIQGNIRTMFKLRSLELFHCDLTAKGLSDILENCPVLDTLRVTGFLVGGKVDEKLGKKCARVKNLILPCKSVVFQRRRRGAVWCRTSVHLEDE